MLLLDTHVLIWLDEGNPQLGEINGVTLMTADTKILSWKALHQKIDARRNWLKNMKYWTLLWLKDLI